MTAPVIDRDGTWDDIAFPGDGDADPVVRITGAHATFRRCTFGAGRNRCVLVERGTLVLEDCVITGSRVAVWATEGATVRLVRCRFEDQLSCALFFTRGAGGTVEDCVVSGSRDAGVVIRSGAAPVLARCTIAATSNGVIVQDGGGGELRDCTLRGAQVGVSIFPGGAPTVLDAWIDGCELIGVHTQGGGRFERCRIDGARMGICFGDGSTTAFTGGRIADASLGICGIAGGGGSAAGVEFMANGLPVNLVPGCGTVISD
jgi:hypothetical protein